MSVDPFSSSLKKSNIHSITDDSVRQEIKAAIAFDYAGICSEVDTINSMLNESESQIGRLQRQLEMSAEEIKTLKWEQQELGKEIVELDKCLKDSCLEQSEKLSKLKAISPSTNFFPVTKKSVFSPSLSFFQIWLVVIKNCCEWIKNRFLNFFSFF